MEFELVDKTWACIKTLPASFLSRMLKNTSIKSTSRYGLSTRHEEAKRNTIGVVGGANAKLSHCTSPMLIYPMENKMPLVHHAVEHWGYGYIDKDGKGLNEMTRI
jgi:hypothetical protein